MMTKMTGALQSVYRVRPFSQSFVLPIDGGSLETEVVKPSFFYQSSVPNPLDELEQLCSRGSDHLPKMPGYPLGFSWV